MFLLWSSLILCAFDSTALLAGSFMVICSWMFSVLRAHEDLDSGWTAGSSIPPWIGPIHWHLNLFPRMSHWCICKSVCNSTLVCQLPDLSLYDIKILNDTILYKTACEWWTDPGYPHPTYARVFRVQAPSVYSSSRFLNTWPRTSEAQSNDVATVISSLHWKLRL